ncbi:nitroreductase [Neisseria chenwenguii]|uniref:Nitroreductase n=1 Tax=Neisseria chenwenguii TaxID=1853278 RepID=A0A220S4F2_9NEIS|nr:nitroreductase [Neisseria chenwenguii]ASK28391.1 nitroreductase [Neisseria chenwenguii]
MLDFETTVRSRQSIRTFLPEEIPQNVIDEVVKDAIAAPSACNTQPWNVHIISGETLKKVSDKIKYNYENGILSPDSYFDQSEYTGIFEARWRNQYKFVYDGFGVAREDKEGRHRVNLLNAEFYGAKHSALFFVPKFGDNTEAIAADMGMFGQNFMLSLTARGYGSIPQLMIGVFGSGVREMLGVSDDYKLVWGVSFGVPDWDAQPNKRHLERVDVSEIVTYHR